MGLHLSKSSSVGAKTPEKKSVAMTIDQSPTSQPSSPSDGSPAKHQFLDPKTPAIPQTPLTQTIATHLNKIAKDDVKQNPSIKTPSYLLRKRILYDLGYTYSIKDTDPRSPSHSIPRTPLSLAEKPEVVIDSEASSFQYSTLEDSCHDFNAKLDDITMEESENDDDQSLATENVEKKNESITEFQEMLCGQKTPDANNGALPQSQSQTEADDIKESTDENSNQNKNEIKNDSDDEKIEDKFMPLDMYSTPITKKSGRAGRIPLSQLNRRGISTEVTPEQSCAELSVEKFKKDLSFNNYDENRSSARKSKIPVFKK